MIDENSISPICSDFEQKKHLLYKTKQGEICIKVIKLGEVRS